MVTRVGAFAVLSFLLAPSSASACGGFFCGQQPVDQQAERIVFAVGPTHTRMIVQIAYRGLADDFAWVLPLGFVPAESDLGTFSALALTQLDANTAPIFVRPDDPVCSPILLNGGGSDADTPGVTVHLEHVVGPYEVVVLEGSSAAELVAWLQGHGFRITDAMMPYVETYVREGMKLLALRLSPNEGVEDIEPFSIRMPTTTPGIPIRLTAVAAEPEMGVLVFVLASQRFGTGNWSELTIDPATIRFASHAWPAETDYLARVAEEADAVMGMGFVTEMAGPTEPLLETVRAATPADDEQRRARDELVALLSDHSYMTRMYARLSPEEMQIDPIFRPHAGGDVPREVQLVRFVDGEDMCESDGLSPCDFALCGAGACVDVTTDGVPPRIAACDCAEGTVARASFGALGEPTVACVDPSRSLIDPGEADPCASFDCGLGSCVAVNMTPTCRCSEGAVAIGLRATDGGRITRCVRPDDVVALPPPPPPPVAIDAGTSGIDAGPSDAGAPIYAPGGGGCGCVVARRSEPSLLVLLFALALVARRARSGR